MVATPHSLAGMFIAVSFERLRQIRRQKRQKKSGQTEPPRPKEQRSYLAIIILLSFASHFLLDGLPHFDYAYATKDGLGVNRLGSDFLFSLLFFAVIFWRPIKITGEAMQRPIGELQRFAARERSRYLQIFPLTFCAIVSAWLPDILIALVSLLSGEGLAAFKRFHDFFHTSVTLDIWIGSFVNVVICLGLAFATKWQVAKIVAEIELEKRAEEEARYVDAFFAGKKNSFDNSE